MHNLVLWRKGLRELRQLSPGTFAAMLVQNISSALRPILMVWFLAQAVNAVTNGNEKSALLQLGSIFIVMTLLFALEQILSAVSETRTHLLYGNELRKVSQVLTVIPYHVFVKTEMQEKIAAYKSARAQNGSAFRNTASFTATLLQGLLSLALSIWLLAPFLRVSWQKNGSGLNSPWTLVAMIGAMAVGGTAVLLISSCVNHRFFRLRQQYISVNRLFEYYSELLRDPNNGKELRLFHAEQLILNHATEGIATRGLEIQKQLVNLQAVSGIAYAFIGAALGGLIYFYLGSKGLSGALSAGDIVLSVGAFLQVLQAITLLAETAGQVRSIAPALNYYFGITQAPLTEKLKRIPCRDVPQFIEFRNVTFRYPGMEHDALHDLSLTIYPGEPLAVVGENGSGKTTLINLLCRLYEPQSGEILLNGVNIQEHDLDEYQTLLSVVFQDFVLFAQPVGANIVCDMDMDFVEQKIKNLVPLDLNRTATTLSGGESQKVAIARALYRDAPIVIFDEPTASLDPIAERDIYQSFAAQTKGKTAIYISHRLASCRFCERVVVFDGGHIIESGGHEELLAQKGKYAKLWGTQAGLYQN